MWRGSQRGNIRAKRAAASTGATIVIFLISSKNDDHRLDLLNGDPVDKLKQILECQDVSFLLGLNFDLSNLEHFFLDMEGEAERKHKGRQKIEMKLIECENARSVTFSKRKRTLFEKAKRAAASTGATIAIFLISSKGYMHAFGTSCVHAIINEYHARRSNDNAPIAVAQNDDHRLDLLNGDPVDKLKQILECQDVSFLLGPNFDPSNLEHVTAAYSWFDDCRTKLKAKKEKKMSANPVANEQMVSTAQFDLNVTAAASPNQVLVSANLARGFNLNVAPSADDLEMISATSHVRRFNLNVIPGADDDKEAEEKEEMARANPTRGFNLNVAPDDDEEEMIPTPSN
nr:MADS-box protein FLOWERING LOCUS C-like [Ipomoea trifida]